ncbi:carboxylesterase [Penicillium verhagenii]|nr:carboxylesterase [Penicillium verhagenii]
MTSFVNKGLAALALGAAVAEAQLWDKVIQTSLEPLEAPQPRESWNETYDAISWGHPCPSNGVDNISEDCLNLNVWTNAGTADAKHPVILWNQGSDETSNDAWWYGGGMALKDVILITFNRRDDVFGYLSHADLNAEGLAATGHNTSGNYGVLDQLEVLKWIQKNIANFGGDPDRVTVAGQSFGSSQVYHAVNSPLFKGYFHGGISESGIRWPRDPMLAGLATSYNNMSAALFHGTNYTTFHNASTIAEMREKSMEDLLIGSQDRVNSTWIWWVTALSADYPLIFKPVLDDYVLPEKYIDSLKNGPANDVPVITGNAKDESGAALSTDYTLEEYKSYCTLKYGDLAKRYFELYPATTNQTLADHAWNAAARDMSVNQGAFHQSEIMYALNALYANADTYPFTAIDYEIQEQMSSYWANFAKTLNPNMGGSYQGSGKLAEWTPNTANGTKVVMELGNYFGNVPIARGQKYVDFIMDYFSQQFAY